MSSEIKIKAAIFGVPRSGTSWLGQIMNSSPQVLYRFQPLFSYEFKNRLNESSTPTEIELFNQNLLSSKSDFVLQTRSVGGTEMPDPIKKRPSHLIWKEVRYINILTNLLHNSDMLIMGIVRHPCAVINSWINTFKEFDEDWNPLDEWKEARIKNADKKENFYGYEKWKEVAFLFLELRKIHPEKFKLIQYENLHSHTYDVIKDCFKFLSLPYTEKTTNFISKSKSIASSDPYDVFRKLHDKEVWKRQLHPLIVEQIVNDKDYHILSKVFKWKE